MCYSRWPINLENLFHSLVQDTRYAAIILFLQKRSPDEKPFNLCLFQKQLKYPIPIIFRIDFSEMFLEVLREIEP